MSTFRNDINGLRAWAVAAVVLYHFGLAGISGGFVGVDIFFVISGLLMTGILVRGLERMPPGGAPRLVWRFYLARAQRILPALLAVCALLLALGWFFLPAADYDELARQVVGAATFSSNVKFWRETGYFSPNVREIWLLHTWSLSVEWQFYLVLPLALLGAWKLRPRRSTILGVLLVGSVVSLGLSLWLMTAKASTAFFLLPPRAWEMMLGGMVGLSGKQFARREQLALELLGFLLIISSVVVFTADSAWPGWRALVPAVGTALVLLAARQDSPWSNNRVAQWLGDRSYSLYLWHWPILVALVYVELDDNVAALAAGLIFALGLSQVSYRFIEQSSKRYFGRVRQGATTFTLAGLAFAVILPCVAITANSGFLFRMPGAVNVMLAGARDVNNLADKCLVSGNTPVPGCVYGGPKLGVIVIGDSHAASIMRAVEKSLPSPDLHVLDWSLTRCGTMRGIKDKNDPQYRCSEFVDWAESEEAKLPRGVPIIIMNRISLYAYGVNTPSGRAGSVDPTYYFSNKYSKRTPQLLAEIQSRMVETACAFAKDRKVYMIRPTPELIYDVPKTVGRAMALGRQRDVSISLDEYHAREKFAWAAQDAAHEQCGVTILDPTPYLCRNGLCDGTRNGRPLYRDDSHLSEYGASYLVPLFKTIFHSGTAAAGPEPKAPSRGTPTSG